MNKRASPELLIFSFSLNCAFVVLHGAQKSLLWCEFNQIGHKSKPIEQCRRQENAPVHGSPVVRLESRIVAMLAALLLPNQGSHVTPASNLAVKQSLNILLPLHETKMSFQWLDIPKHQWL